MSEQQSRQNGALLSMSSQIIWTEKIRDRIQDGRYQEILEILQQRPGMDVISLRDSKQQTLVHLFVLRLRVDDVEFLINYATNNIQQNSQTVIKDWINIQSIEGLTALHYAAFKGDLEILQFLVSLKADLTLKNNSGLTALHIAAQGDQPISLCYLISLGISLEEKEDKGGTALHWASYLGSENALNFLISRMKHLINTPDNEGLTPLHLSVISGNARVVKKLLQRGADRDALDLNNNSAAKLAKENDFLNILSMLEDTGGFAEYCNIKQPFKPKDKSISQLLVLALLLLGCSGCIILLVFPCFISPLLELIIWGTLNVLSVIFLLFAWLTNPGAVSGIQKQRVTQQQSNKVNQSLGGRINKSGNENQSIEEALGENEIQGRQKNIESDKTRRQLNNSGSGDDPTDKLIRKDNESNTHSIQPPECLSKEEQLALLIFQIIYLLNILTRFNQLQELIRLYSKTRDDSRICVECNIVKPKRSRHCEVCRQCVRVYDHHCPWINNCVGTQNYVYFISFILTMWFNMVVSLVLMGLHIGDDFSECEGYFSFWYENLSDNMNTIKIIRYIVIGIVIFVALFFLCLHSILCFVQLSNLFLNQTTFERYNSHKPAPSPLENSGGKDSKKQTQNFKSDLSKSDFNPSLIQSNQQALQEPLPELNKEQSQQEISYLKNAITMCCINKNNQDYDYFLGSEIERKGKKRVKLTKDIEA